MKRDFVVNVTKLTKAVSQQGFGLILILGTSGKEDYALYGGTDEVSEVFGVDSKEYKIASRIFGQNPAPQEIAIAGIDWDAGVSEVADLITELNAINNKDNDWFHLCCTENDNEIAQALGDWADANDRIYWVTTQDLELLASQDLELPASPDLELPASMKNENAVVMYHDDADAYVAEGLAAYAATTKPGEITFKFKTVNGVSAADVTSTELAQLHEDGGFSYVRKMGVLQTTEGKVTNGEYIDVVLGAYFLKFRIEEEAMYLAINTKKIPYSNVGIGMLVGIVDSVFKQGVRQGIILEDNDGNGVYEINALTREEVSKNDVANRVYNGLEATATLAGAIHSGEFNITLTY